MPNPTDRDLLESTWQANERELNRIAGMGWLGRQLEANRREAPEAEQDGIGYRLGFDQPGDADRRRWSSAK